MTCAAPNYKTLIEMKHLQNQLQKKKQRTVDGVVARRKNPRSTHRLILLLSRYNINHNIVNKTSMEKRNFNKQAQLVIHFLQHKTFPIYLIYIHNKIPRIKRLSFSF